MTTEWQHAALALRVLADAPYGLGGMVIRMRAGPDRDTLVNFAKSLFPDIIRISPNVDDIHLFGGIDMAATLSSGHVRRSQGLLSQPRTLCLTMAERLSPALSARLAQYLDATPGAILLALDESVDEAEGVPSSLTERLAFFAEPAGHAPDGWTLPELSFRDSKTGPVSPAETLTQAAIQFGIPSLRAPLQAITTARVLRSMCERSEISNDDITTAASLVYAHRATQIPTEPDDAQEASDTNNDHDETMSDKDSLNLPEGDLVIDAVKALLPPEMLAGLGRLGSTKGAKGSGAGKKKKSNRRGRPLPARPGRLDGRNRLNILATLRAAAPWQPVRKRQTPDRTGLLLRPSDFRVKRYESKSDRLVIFAVDASGSAAISRLNEAKGAIELLLGQAYAARDHVALVSFRGDAAELLLPPTRSLVQTKRKLSALPGGGGTPLASGLLEALQCAEQARNRGMTPIVVLITDGKTNVALDGNPDRKRAKEDAVKVATQLRMQGHEVLVIDSAARPQPALRDLTQHLDGTYLPLPRADAQRVSSAVKSAFETA